jgi:hypothetical protein
MRTLAAAVLSCALALAAVAGSASAAAHHPKPCARKGSHTVAANAHARVYSVPTADGSRLYGCLRRDNHRRLLTEATDDGYVTSSAYDKVALTGPFVAWQQTSTDDSCKADCPPGYNPTTTWLGVRDLRRRKSRTVAGQVAPAGRIVITTGGALAWIAPGYAVNAYDGAGARTLDSGSDVQPGSLSHHGATVSWVDGAETRSAALTPPR